MNKSWQPLTGTCSTRTRVHLECKYLPDTRICKLHNADSKDLGCPQEQPASQPDLLCMCEYVRWCFSWFFYILITFQWWRTDSKNSNKGNKNKLQYMAQFFPRRQLQSTISSLQLQTRRCTQNDLLSKTWGIL